MWFLSLCGGLHLQCSSTTCSHLPLSVFVNACVASCLQWPCMLYLEWCWDVFNYSALSGYLDLAAPCYFALCFEAQYADRSAFCSPPLRMHWVLSQWIRWELLYNGPFINHPLVLATKLTPSFLPPEIFSEPIKDELKKQVYFFLVHVLFSIPLPTKGLGFVANNADVPFLP